MPKRIVLLVLITALAVTTQLAIAQTSSPDNSSPRVAEVLHFVEAIEETHPEGHLLASRADWSEAVAELYQAAEGDGQEVYLVALMRLLATLHDGHTTMPMGLVLGSGLYPQRLPLVLRAFDDGLFVIEAKDEAMPLLGARVTSFGGEPIAEVSDRFAAVWPGNNVAWAYHDLGFLALPALVAGMGLTTSEEAPVSISVEMLTGETVSATLLPSPSATNGRASIERTMTPRELWAKEAGGPNFLRRLTEDRTLYVSIGTIGDTGALSFDDLTDEVAVAVAEPGYDRLIVDLRYNSGGNNMLSERLRRVVATSQFNHPGGLYVLISPQTFSAAVNVAGRFERDTFAIFVGEPSGAGPNHFGDATLIKGDDSGISIAVSTLRWQDSVPFDKRVWIMPDVFVPQTYQDWLRGHDAALAAAMDHKAERNQSDSSWFTPWQRSSQRQDWEPFWRR